MNEKSMATVIALLESVRKNATERYRETFSCPCGQCKNLSPVAEAVTDQVSGPLADFVCDEANAGDLGNLGVACVVSAYVFDALSVHFALVAMKDIGERNRELRSAAQFYRNMAAMLEDGVAASGMPIIPVIPVVDSNCLPPEFSEMPPEIQERIKKIVSEMRASMGILTPPKADKPKP